MSADPEQLYVQLGRLVETMPDLREPLPLSAATQQWLGRVGALIAASGDVPDIAEFQTYVSSLNFSEMQHTAAGQLVSVIYRALAKAELKAPAAVQGSFIPAGNAFDPLSAIAKVVGNTKRNVLIVDPYLDEKALTDFCVLVPEKTEVRLLSDQQTVKPTLRPAAARWVTQYGATRPLVVKLTPPKTLHDRLIAIDDAAAYVLTQSLNAFAARSPASIVRVDEETAKLKIAAYQAIWSAATRM
jgi:hypothetical protein